MEVKPVETVDSYETHQNKSVFNGATITVEVEYTIEEFLAILTNQKDLIMLLPTLISSIKDAIEGKSPHPVADAVAKVEDAT